MKNYYDFLKEELNNYEGNFDKFILNVPDFFKLLCSLLDEPKIKSEDKRKINSALAYFVVPNDVISEDIYGPAGFVDDIFACTYVLNELKKKYGIELIAKHWEGEEDFDIVLASSHKKSLELLEKQNLVQAVLECMSLR